MRFTLFITLLISASLEVGAINTTIYSKGLGSYENLFNFLSLGNSSLGEELVSEFVTTYMEEAKAEGINWDVAFVQMCLETGFLKYGGLVQAGQNNFCGLGSFDGKTGASFPTIRDGVRAHIQHLKAYGSDKELNYNLIDPRFHLVKRGSAQNVMELAGKWAEDPLYGFKLVSLLERMLIQETPILIADASEVIKEKVVKVEPVKEKVVENKKSQPEKRGWDW